MIHTVLDITNPVFEELIVGQSPLNVNITDDDLGVVVISPSDGSTELSESGTIDAYQVALNMVPSSSVQITVQADVRVFLSNADQQATAVDANAPANTFLSFNSLNRDTRGGLIPTETVRSDYSTSPPSEEISAVRHPKIKNARCAGGFPGSKKGCRSFLH